MCDLLERKVDQLGADTIASFEAARVPGSVFMDLTETDLKEIVGERKGILKLINSYKPSQVSVINSV